MHDLTIATTHAYTHTDVLITNRGARCRGPGAFLCLLLLRCAVPPLAGWVTASDGHEWSVHVIGLPFMHRGG